MPPPPPPPPGPPPASAFKQDSEGDIMTDDGQAEGQDVGEGEHGEDNGNDSDGGVHGDAQMAFMHRQPLAKSGMAATLGLLMASGDLNKKDEVKVC